MIDAQKIDMFIQEGEGLTVEFKERFSPRIVEDMTAFANTKGASLSSASGTTRPSAAKN